MFDDSSLDVGIRQAPAAGRSLPPQPFFAGAAAAGLISFLMILLSGFQWHLFGYVLATIGSTAGALGWRASNVRRAFTGRQSKGVRQFGIVAMSLSLSAALVHSVFIAIDVAT